MTEQKSIKIKLIVSLSILLGLGFAFTTCDNVDPKTGKTVVYPVVNSSDAGFTVNGKHVTLIKIDQGDGWGNRYMYVVSSVPVEAQNSIAYTQGKTTSSVTNVELP